MQNKIFHIHLIIEENISQRDVFLQKGNNVHQLSKVLALIMKYAFDVHCGANRIWDGPSLLTEVRSQDLVCRNCVVSQLHKGSTPKGSPGVFLVKISDFGMSRDVYTTNYVIGFVCSFLLFYCVLSCFIAYVKKFCVFSKRLIDSVPFVY